MARKTVRDRVLDYIIDDVKSAVRRAINKEVFEIRRRYGAKVLYDLEEDYGVRITKPLTKFVDDVLDWLPQETDYVTFDAERYKNDILERIKEANNDS